MRRILIIDDDDVMREAGGLGRRLRSRSARAGTRGAGADQLRLRRRELAGGRGPRLPFRLPLLLEEFRFRGYTGFDNRVRLLAWAFLENFGYRQITAVWRVRGAVRFLRGRTDWGAMVRKGFESTT